ncbi:transcriptional regulator [Gluconacetobacter liquefaciens]|uniref:AraC family transcriptional regulator n=1 Tax=Gluconacetobacter liquefaciens TaxID=89584 RepID=A0A370FY45_GLULI|nr:helix-turn-helix transcriptional regulator [Gluconacetobacter liquefaciens]MBB2187422.1 helix-turn-helix transcriptional regulator [Gluconacetobacter liquefaciens]RDI36388.1 AraC family transcriptional regulator [Gluconacetobacter liquefaciens]GBQ92283.1 AraC family transcriptional regulator [Gluconacetobacter liquefaciens NRIC 0522]GEB37945.1 transcriptional regulator [Gluconacetobacter liquefaciens]
MVWNRRVEQIEDSPRDIVALGNAYIDGHVIAPHSHRRTQLLCATSGAVMVTTRHGTWVMPPQRAIWIPAGSVHQVRMLGAVRSNSLYLKPSAIGAMPADCCVVGLSAFMRALLAEAVELPADYDMHGRAGALMNLIRHEIADLPVVPLFLPVPGHEVLASMCRAFLADPSIHETIEAWSGRLGVRPRSFTRMFRRETGMSFMAWRQQACLIAALPRLVAGEPVTTIAMDLGYDNPAAFTAMFRKMLGASPRRYLAGQDDVLAPVGTGTPLS